MTETISTIISTSIFPECTPSVSVASVRRNAVVDDQDAEFWLSHGEQEIYKDLRNPSRRRNWLLGRIATKQLISEASGSAEISLVSDPRRIEIFSRDERGRGARPRVYIDGRMQRHALSIAHTEKSVVVALALEDGTVPGIDVTPVQTQSDGFLQLWFTPAEQEHVSQADPDQRARIISTIWAMKEAYYKATNVGLPFLPAAIEVRGIAGDFSAYQIGMESQALPGCLHEANGEVVALVLNAKRRQTRP